MVPGIYLLLSLIMPGDKPQINFDPIPMVTISDCMAEAERFVKRGIPDRFNHVPYGGGAVAVMAGCVAVGKNPTRS